MMKLLLDHLDELFAHTGYSVVKKEENPELNSAYNDCMLFFSKESEISELTGEPLEVVLYSKYYWLTQYMKKYNQIKGYDAGIEQQRFQLIEELEQRLKKVDWDLIQRMEEEM